VQTLAASVRWHNWAWTKAQTAVIRFSVTFQLLTARTVFRYVTQRCLADFTNVSEVNNASVVRKQTFCSLKEEEDNFWNVTQCNISCARTMTRVESDPSDSSSVVCVRWFSGFTFQTSNAISVCFIASFYTWLCLSPVYCASLSKCYVIASYLLLSLLLQRPFPIYHVAQASIQFICFLCFASNNIPSIVTPSSYCPHFPSFAFLFVLLVFML
jgi:hypothetical protein